MAAHDFEFDFERNCEVRFQDVPRQKWRLNICTIFDRICDGDLQTQSIVFKCSRPTKIGVVNTELVRMILMRSKRIMAIVKHDGIISFVFTDSFKKYCQIVLLKNECGKIFYIKVI